MAFFEGEEFMRKLVILASLVVAAAISANCAKSSEGANSLMAPSSINGADAKKPGPATGQTGTIALVGNPFPSFGDTVTFEVFTTATAYPWVTLRCYQNGALVSQESNAVGRGLFTLGPSGLWTGGAADCTATLENWDNYSSKKGSITVLGSTSFPVN
jgi:hypothetical protein